MSTLCGYPDAVGLLAVARAELVMNVLDPRELIDAVFCHPFHAPVGDGAGQGDLAVLDRDVDVTAST